MAKEIRRGNVQINQRDRYQLRSHRSGVYFGPHCRIYGERVTSTFQFDWIILRIFHGYVYLLWVWISFVVDDASSHFYQETGLRELDHTQRTRLTRTGHRADLYQHVQHFIGHVFGYAVRSFRLFNISNTMQVSQMILTQNLFCERCTVMGILVNVLS